MVAASESGGKITVTDNNGLWKKSVSIPATGGEKLWKPVEIKNISLSESIQLKIQADKGGFNLKEMVFLE
jgi:hypothetical protein